MEYKEKFFNDRQKNIDNFNKINIKRWAKNEVKKELMVGLLFIIILFIGFLIVL